MRVLLVCDWFLKDTTRLAPELKRLGVEVAILCTRHAEEFADFDERERALAPVRSADIEVFEFNRSLRTVAPQIQAARICRLMRKWQPDVAFVHFNRDPRLLLMTAGIPVVLHIHDPTPHPGEQTPPWYRRAVSNLWICRADRFTVHGSLLRDEVERQRPSKRVAVFPLGIVPKMRPDPVPDVPAVLFFGRLYEYKGLDVLLDAMRSVWDVRPDVRLIVAGGGPLEGMIPPDPRVTGILGYLPEARVDAVFASATVLVLPYRQASQSGPGGQALERGIPVVATTVGALPELVSDPTALVAPNDPEALARAILAHLDHDLAWRTRLLRDATTRMSSRVSAAVLLEILASARTPAP